VHHCAQEVSFSNPNLNVHSIPGEPQGQRLILLKNLIYRVKLYCIPLSVLFLSPLGLL
jgi:hypothetical protein